jgi:hypothetical protein
VVKEYGNSFNKAGLRPILQSRGVDTVIVTGCCAAPSRPAAAPSGSRRPPRSRR